MLADMTWVVVLGAIVFIGLFVFAVVAAMKRRKELAAWAARNGMRFDPSRCPGMDDEFNEFKCLRRGHNRYAKNRIYGNYRGWDIEAFDYHYETGSGDDETSHIFSAVIVRSSLPLKRLTLRPENFFDRVGDFFGLDDIDFESAEFSRRYCVKADDRKWAYDVLHSRAIEHLLHSPKYYIQMAPREVIIYGGGKVFDPAEFRQAADTLIGLLDMLPDYVRQQQMQGVRG